MAKLDQVRALLSSGRLDEACQQLQKIVRRNPRDAGAWFLLGAAHGNRRRVDEAIACLTRVVELDPGHGEAHFNLAQAHMHKNQYPLAVRHYRETIARNPNHFDALNNISAALNEMGQRAEAIHYLREAVRARPESEEARFLLAALTGQEGPAHPPTRYVRGLFNGYADRFESHLVKELRYQIPEHLRRAIGQVIGERSAELVVADLGCGTGLCGLQLRNLARRLDGVDLASRMVERARAKGVYDHVEAGDLVSFLRARPREYDLITAADVLIYVGDARDCFDACHAALVTGGIFAFSVEASGDSSKPFELCDSYRYKHGRDYLLGLARETGFVPQHVEEVVVRMEKGQLVQGCILVLQAVRNAA